MMSSEKRKYIKRYKKNKRFILYMQLLILISFISLWQILASLNIINTFITSSPILIINNIYNLFINNNLIYHIFITLKETIIAFTITFALSFIISTIIYLNKTFDKIIEPYLTLLNSLPKVALGPLLIITIGANERSIITMAVLISIIVSIENISLGFKNTDKLKVKLLKSNKATNYQIFKYLVLPSNIDVFITNAKVILGLCLIGTITGEFLTSKAGIGYLILYGSQVFNLTLVMSGILILLLLSTILYLVIKKIEKRLVSN